MSRAERAARHAAEVKAAAQRRTAQGEAKAGRRRRHRERVDVLYALSGAKAVYEYLAVFAALSVRCPACNGSTFIHMPCQMCLGKRSVTTKVAKMHLGR